MSQTARRSPQTARRPLESPNLFPHMNSRLPRGPHSLSREQVAANQRMRIGMAMLETIGEKGYVASTVSEVVGRAGVSRKAFYQHFTNKEECFLATYDAIVEEGRRRVARTLSEARAGADRTETAIRALFMAAVENRDALRLAMTEITAVGPGGYRAPRDGDRRIWKADPRQPRAGRQGGRTAAARRCPTRPCGRWWAASTGCWSPACTAGGARSRWSSCRTWHAGRPCITRCRNRCRRA